MRLTSFSVSNYRSITKAHSVSLHDLTVLIGKNNEGKSNILRALDAAMSLLRRHSVKEKGSQSSRLFYTFEYKWKRDFPIQLQERNGSRKSIFRLEFSLEPSEIYEFKSRIGVNLNGLLPLEIVIGKEEEPEFRIVKTGKGTKTLTSKSSQIARFVAEKINFNYIPAIRTDKETNELIKDMLANELRALEEDPNYIAALHEIARIQKPALDAIAARVEDPLKEFLPSIKSVSLKILDDERKFSLRRSISVIIDDGTPTALEYKGDGVKSLAALGLLKNSNKSVSSASILAIEEPESHLHPGAIHQVNEIIRSISGQHQVILTTHNPLFVDREKLSANIIVSDGGANPAKTIKHIRDLLGIRASDNLMHANYALVVEGPEDVTSLQALLPHLSAKIMAAIKSHMLVIEPVGGAGNLSYKLSQLKNALCATHVLLDNDRSGRDAFARAEADGTASLAQTTFTLCQGCPDSEFEDLIDPQIYSQRILIDFGVNISNPRFRGNDKWSSRIKATFAAHGKPCTDITLSKIKNIVSHEVASNPSKALNPKRSNPITSLVTALENLIIINN